VFIKSIPPIILITLLFNACSHKTTVVLLESGKAQNAIIVTTNKGSSRLDRVGSFVKLKNKNEAPSEIQLMSKDEIHSRYATLFKATPTKPKTYIVYFKTNSTELTNESKEILQQALETIKKRSPCMVDIIGHTDTVGSDKINAEISLKRANFVKSMILTKQIKTVSLTAKGYGEEELLMKTSDNVSEAKNRNVEIFIK
jgi:outer membrane protein OmpA-like peptidoglycan-associated protein